MEPPCVAGEADYLQAIRYGIANYEAVAPVAAPGANELRFRHQVPGLYPTPVCANATRLPLQLPAGGAVSLDQTLAPEVLEPGDGSRRLVAGECARNDGNVARTGYVRQIEIGDELAVDEEPAALSDSDDAQVVAAPGAGVEGREGPASKWLVLGVRCLPPSQIRRIPR